MLKETHLKRKPLAITARRAGWVGCNIDLKPIPKDGKIFIIKDGKEISKEIVLKRIQKNLFLKSEEFIVYIQETIMLKQK